MRDVERGLLEASAVFGAVAVFALHAAALLPVVVGWSPQVVTTSSMSPSIRPGDVVLTDWVTGADVAVGDIVMFDLGDGPVTHRIVEVLADGAYRTRGDNNPTVDSTTVRPHQVRGVVRAVVPHAGRLLGLLTRASP